MAGKPKKNIVDSRINLEIYGLIVIALGVVIFLSILYYQQTDPKLWTMGAANDYGKVQNILGIVGASIGDVFFKYTLGYPALVFPILIILVGVYMMAGYAINTLSRHTLLALGWSYLTSIVLAMPETLMRSGFSADYYPSGLIGGFTSDMVYQYFGRFALGFFSIIFFLILLMSTFRVPLSVIPQNIIKYSHQGWLALSAALGKFLAKAKAFQWLPQESPGTTKKASAANGALGKLGRALNKLKAASPLAEPTVRTVIQPSTGENPVHSLEDIEEETYEEIPAAGTAEPAGQRTEPVVVPPGPAMDEFTRDDPRPEAEVNEANLVFPQKYVEPEPDLDASRILENVNTLNPDEMGVLNAADYDVQVKAAMEKYVFPSTDFLDNDGGEDKISREELMANADLLENTLAQFGVKAFVKKVIEGPVITLYAVRPAEGVKINQVVSLADDLALAMRAKGIRMIAPIPGEAAIGIEIPNRNPSTVYFQSIASSEKFTGHNGQLTIGMGKTIGGEVFCADLTRMPHLLIAGATGAGKSVGINTIIASILYRVPPSDVKFVMIDPKKLELSLYAKLKDHYLAICPDLDEIVITHPQNAILVLKSVVNEMEERYDQLASVGVRDIISYNNKIKKFEEAGKKSDNLRRLPYIIVIIDELADLILTASREVEEPITRLAQMARAVGIHLIVATQRPSVDILTGLIKANFPTRIAYQVATRPDSKVILDMYGAEKLIGQGDFLFLPPGTGKPVRLQNPYISTEEVESLIDHIRKQPKFPPYELKLERKVEINIPAAARRNSQDELFETAKEIVVRHQQGSISLLQRKLKVGYARAARLIDELEVAGVVGTGQGSKARDVLISAYSDE